MTTKIKLNSAITIRFANIARNKQSIHDLIYEAIQSTPNNNYNKIYNTIPRNKYFELNNGSQ